MDLIVALVTGQKVTDKDIQNELYNICDREHASCNSDCPVFALKTKEEQDNLDSCSTFKNGEKMMNFIKERG